MAMAKEPAWSAHKGTQDLRGKSDCYGYYLVRRFFWGTQDAPSLELSALRMLGVTREKDYRKMVHFTGPANHIPYVPYHQALKPDFYLPEGFFKQQIIIVGKYSRQSKEGNELTGKYRLHLQPPSPVRGVDMFATPFYIIDDRLPPGVEIHANMLLSLLEDDVLKPLKRTEAVMLIIFLSVFLTFLNRKWSPLKSISLNVVVAISYLFSSYFLFSKQGLFLPFSAPLSAIFINFVSSGVISYVGVERKRRHLRKAFSLYLSPQVEIGRAHV